MLSPIKNFILRDHAPTQVILYSVPILNVCVRIFQSDHSLDNVADIDAFNIKKENFKNHMNNAIAMQLALTVTTLALCILLPPATTIGLHINSIFALSLGLTLSNILCDSFLRSEHFVPRAFRGPESIIGW